MMTVLSKQTTPPRRLWLFFASEAPIAVILKRGPTDWVQLVKWDVANDHFEAGQWLKARVGEENFDIAPDGKLIVYWARGNSAREFDTWTAVSKPPYFTALALWPWYGTYFGGGFFESSTRLWLNNNEVPPLASKFEPGPLDVTAGWDRPDTALPLYTRKLIRRGWLCIQLSTYRETWSNKPKHKYKVPITEELWTWHCPDGSTIRSLSMGPPVFGFKNAILSRILPNGDDVVIDYPVCDWDQRGRMVRTDQGKIFVAEWQAGQLVETELVDLNRDEPAPLAPPVWAKTWGD